MIPEQSASVQSVPRTALSVPHVCLICGVLLAGLRRDARTCSATCRSALRRLRAGARAMPLPEPEPEPLEGKRPEGLIEPSVAAWQPLTPPDKWRIGL